MHVEALVSRLRAEIARRRSIRPGAYDLRPELVIADGGVRVVITNEGRYTGADGSGATVEEAAADLIAGLDSLQAWGEL